VLTERGAQIRLGDVAEMRVSDDRQCSKRKCAPLQWVYIDLHVELSARPCGTCNTQWPGRFACRPVFALLVGQFEFLERATARLKIVVPATLVIIFVLLYLTFRRFSEAALIMATLPFALVGGFWLMFLLDYNMSIAW